MVFFLEPRIGAGLSGYIAEMGSAFLCAALGIVPTVRHADYIASWLEVLRADNRAIFRAASAAPKAADWLLSRHAQAQEGRIAACCSSPPTCPPPCAPPTLPGTPRPAKGRPTRTRPPASNSST